MQRSSTSILAGQVALDVPVTDRAEASRSVRPLTLYDALRQGDPHSRPHRIEAGDPPELNVQSCAIGRVEMLKASGGPLSIDTDGSSTVARVTALIQIEGTSTARQGARTAEIGPGDLCLTRSGRPLSLRVEGSFRFALIEAPEDEIADRFPLWRAAMLTPIRGSSGVPAVFCDAVHSLHRWQDSLGGAANDGLADAVINLMGALVCFAVPINRDCVQQSLFQKDRIKKIVQLNLRNPALNVDLIAGSLGLSPRQIHRVFSDEGISLMRWVWVLRLEQCYRELRQDASGKRSISDIAYTWGFHDQAHFSRAFRKQFGISPREARSQLNTGISDATPAL
ncbi:helix-turn-helix domain-containing protein [Thiocystis violascens]|uniref:DNA-binding domain-containing protein, AraC-type n=1 Tax=Thiocystis violascens (strain ATCC 17096 / DSM 198 / 6111) TaxID=765911 RepID=I3YED6_THIV6|nr:helix-turn-helix domain-containing protein [Thiocystis violascens]AFL75354.1 DNA-binding domain-containing protein, AraC-type [Thiocystis violascens DSM 198]